MKFFSPFILFFLIISCSENNRDISQIDNKEMEISSNDVDTVFTENNSNLAVQENALTIAEMPLQWYKLDEINEAFVINKYCEAETPQLIFEKVKNSWFIVVITGQDSHKFKVIEFEVYEEIINNQDIIKGTFIIENPSFPDMDPEMYDFYWNTTEKYCNFEGFFNETTRMVDKKNKGFYKFIEEKCD